MFVKLHITDKTEECLAATTCTLVKRINFLNILSVCGKGGGGILNIDDSGVNQCIL